MKAPPLAPPPRPPRRGLQPAASSRLDVPILLLTLASCGAAVAALLLQWAGWVAMPYGVSLITLPGMLLLLVIVTRARRGNPTLLLNRIAVGTVGGLLGLLAYDLIRLFVQVALPLHFNAFLALNV